MIIDFRFTAPTPGGLTRYISPAPHMQKYAAAYGDRVFGGKNPDVRFMEVTELLAFMDRSGVDKVFIKTGDAETTLGAGKKYAPADLYEYIKEHPDRLMANVGVDPYKGETALEEMELAIRELGFKGIGMQPFELKLYANDKRCYPFYAKAQELGVPVLIHTSINFVPEMSLDHGRPIYLDEVASHFPNLKIVAVHGGWPWVLEMIAVAWRHPNVFIEISGVRPKYIATPNSGWDPLLVYGNGLLQDKVLWASNWPMGTPEEGIEGVRSFPLKESVKEKWLGLNAARVL
ncbi:MAG: amidohydrolase, partial [Chloroflexi bacterium]|nr:amidohydrolase [Chloroflexota bacterium]